MSANSKYLHLIVEYDDKKYRKAFESSHSISYGWIELFHGELLRRLAKCAESVPPRGIPSAPSDSTIESLFFPIVEDSKSKEISSPLYSIIGTEVPRAEAERWKAAGLSIIRDHSSKGTSFVSNPEWKNISWIYGSDFCQ